MKSTDLGSSSFCLKRSLQYCVMQNETNSDLDTKSNYLQSSWVSFRVSFFFFCIYLLTYSVLTADCRKMFKLRMEHLNNEHLYKQGERLVVVSLWTVVRSDPVGQPVWHSEAHLLYTPTAKYDPYIRCVFSLSRLVPFLAPNLHYDYYHL